MEPPMSKMLIASVDLGCSEEILTVVAMLSAQNIFYRPREKQSQADQKKAKFFQPEARRRISRTAAAQIPSVTSPTAPNPPPQRSETAPQIPSAFSRAVRARSCAVGEVACPPG